MKSQIVSVIAAASIALTSFSAPAQAAPTEEEMWLLLFGAAAVAFIAGQKNAPAPAPAPAPAGPVTHSTGPVNIPQTWAVNLDNGNLSSNGQSDIWFQAVTAAQLFLTPRNGAKISFDGGAQRGYAGCSTATYSANSVPLWAVPVGSYVCVKTNKGRFSEFRLNQLTAGSPKTMKIGYTTWK